MAKPQPTNHSYWPKMDWPKLDWPKSATTARRHNHIALVKPPVVGTACQPDCQDSKEGRKIVLLHNRCVAQGIARCGSKAAGGVLRHHAARDAPFRDEQRQGVTLQSKRSRSGGMWLASTSLRRFEKSAHLSRLVADPAQALVKIQEHARKVPVNLMPAGLSERDVKRAPPKPSQRDTVAALKGRRAVNGRRSSFCQGAAVLWPHGALLSSGNSAIAAGP